ncbi:Vitamin K-dependent protein C (Fragment) [Seminavis robusta]|uniref:Vitamin K-dependent protein C n=1 Tax=Seminavis robusta TaxID=568900 RepID=A0A9N8EMM7_9STRA
MGKSVGGSLLLSLGLLLSCNLLLVETRLNGGGRLDNAEVGSQSTGTPKRDLWQTRIVGGREAPSGIFPYFVELANGCGGCLIHNDLVLTAAHCVYGHANMALLRSYPRVFIGGVVAQSGRAERSIIDFRIDPRYNPTSASYDFAILLLDNPVEIATPLQLNSEPMFPVEGQPLTIVGYGFTNQGIGRTASRLQQASVNYRSDCKSTYANGRVKEYEMMCAHAPDYSRDACQGDSGGPLIAANNVLVGVVSWGEGCAQLNAPGIYARVSAANEWMAQQKCEFSNVPPADCVCTRQSADCVPIQVNVTYDSYSTETGWQLVRPSDGAVIVSSPAKSISTSRLDTISYPILVPSGSYELHVEDSYGDGMCCQFGSGSISVFDGVGNVLHDGKFDDFLLIRFVASKTQSRAMGDNPPPTRSPSLAPTPMPSTTIPTPLPTTLAPTTPPTQLPRVSLRVEILHDHYPEETSWTLRDNVTGHELIGSPSYSVTTPMQLVAATAPGLVPGQSYTLTVHDIAHDGVCCMYGLGKIQVLLVASSGEEKEVWYHSGEFGDVIEETITIPLP